MYTPVGSICRDMPFHEAIMLYFCLAVNGRRGSGGPGLGGSSSLSLCLPPPPPPPSPDPAELASLPRSQPMFASARGSSNERSPRRRRASERLVAAARVHYPLWPLVVSCAFDSSAMATHGDAPPTTCVNRGLQYRSRYTMQTGPGHVTTTHTQNATEPAAATVSRSSGHNTRTALLPPFRFSPTKKHSGTVAAADHTRTRALSLARIREPSCAHTHYAPTPLPHHLSHSVVGNNPTPSFSRADTFTTGEESTLPPPRSPRRNAHKPSSFPPRHNAGTAGYM